MTHENLAVSVSLAGRICLEIWSTLLEMCTLCHSLSVELSLRVRAASGLYRASSWSAAYEKKTEPISCVIATVSNMECMGGFSSKDKASAEVDRP